MTTSTRVWILSLVNTNVNLSMRGIDCNWRFFSSHVETNILHNGCKSVTYYIMGPHVLIVTSTRFHCGFYFIFFHLLFIAWLPWRLQKGKTFLKGRRKMWCDRLQYWRTKKKHYVGKFGDLPIEDELRVLFKYDGGSKRNGKQETHHSSSAHAWNNFAILFTQFEYELIISLFCQFELRQQLINMFPWRSFQSFQMIKKLRLLHERIKPLFRSWKSIFIRGLQKTLSFVTCKYD